MYQRYTVPLDYNILDSSALDALQSMLVWSKHDLNWLLFKMDSPELEIELNVNFSAEQGNEL